MDNNQPKFLIVGSNDKIELVLNKLPNKNKLNYYYLLDIEEPFIEYGFFLDREDEENNFGEFKIIVFPNEELLSDIILKDVYFKNTNALIICHDYSNILSFVREEIYNINNLLEKEIIHIWFDNKTIPKSNNDEIHYDFYNYEWINKIYNYLDIPNTAPPETICNII